MSDDWKPGDEALCIHPEGQLVSGAVYTVDYVFYGYDGKHWGWAFTLIEHPYAEVGGEVFDGFDAWRFIKPPHTPDAEDAEVIALLNGAGVKEGA